MFVRQKEAKYSQISIYQFFGRQHENRHAIACSKILRKEAVFCKSYKNTLIRVFLHAEFIFALKTEPKPTVFEKYAENRKKIYICYHYFLFFVIFSISFKSQKIENNGNKYIFFLFSAYFSKTVGFGSVFSAKMNSACKNTLIRVFLQDLQKTASFLRIFEQAIAWRFSCYRPKN